MTYDVVAAAPDDAEDSARFRLGWCLGDSTGAGNGLQVAGILLDNWHKGRRRALWVSKSDKLLEDAQRDWAALGQERLLVTPLSRFREATPIKLDEGILFATYATLRSEEREGKASRVQQTVDWLGRDFDRIVVFYEAHAMANAAGGKTGRGDQAPSQQGKAGLRPCRSASSSSPAAAYRQSRRQGPWARDPRLAVRRRRVSAVRKGARADPFVASPAFVIMSYEHYQRIREAPGSPRPLAPVRRCNGGET